MGMFFGRRRGNKRFDYEPRFYDPTRDDRIKRRMRIKSKTQKRGRQQSALTLGILLILVLIVYLSF